MNQHALAECITSYFQNRTEPVFLFSPNDMLTLEVEKDRLTEIATCLRDDSKLQFEMLVDLCAVDYSEYGQVNWQTRETSSTGFSRAQHQESLAVKPWNKPRFAVVYHLLSLTHNHRLRIRVLMEEDDLHVPSLVDIWPSAQWYEREAFDLFGIIFDGHPDLRRLLTDYGFKGHPFRKDYPLIGKVEMRYDAAKKRCVYEPVSIQPRVNIPKVIRVDNRYTPLPDQEKADGEP